MPDSKSNPEAALHAVSRRSFLAFPGTKDIRLHPYFKGDVSKWTWRFYTHRLTRSGRWFLVISTILLIAIVPSLDIQAFVPLIYAAALWLITILFVVVGRPHVTMVARHAERVRAGETLPVELTLKQPPRRLPAIDLNILPERLPLEVDATPAGGVAVGTLAPGESRTVHLGLACPRRGVFKLWGYRVESDFPFGLVNAYRNFEASRTLIVHPRFEPLLRMVLPAGRRYQPGGVLLASKLGESYEYLGNREYREGDNFRDIDWRTTARHGGSPIALREYREEFFLRVGLVLDTHLPRGGGSGLREARRLCFEDAVSLCAGIGDYLARQDYIVDIFAAGPDLYHLTAGRSLAYLDQILDILSCVEGTATEPLEIIAPQIQEYLSRLTTVICVFLRWDEARRRFVESLRESGAGVKLILIRDGVAGDYDPPLPDDAIVLDKADRRAGVTAV
jgi:uncharacterized protein (DUF58 family)